MTLARNTIISVLLPIVLIWSLAVPAGANLAPAWRLVTFDGVSLRVPSAWPVQDLALHPGICPLLDTHAVYLGLPGPDPACPSAAYGKTEAVQLLLADPQSPDVMEAQVPTVIGGRAAMTNADAAVTRTIVDVLPSAGLEVSLSYGSDPALARQIESTITVGAAARPTVLPPGAPAASPAAKQRVYSGRGFDACAAPSAATMSRWLAAPYRAVGIYIGGLNRTCGQPNLTPGWIRRIQAMGWYYFPLYAGLQAPCSHGFGITFSSRHAAAQGAASAADAAAQARYLMIPRGTPVFYDMEPYRGCGIAVVTFLNSWDRELHANGYLAGAYWNLDDLGSLTRAAKKITEPDIINYAHWDGQPTTKSSYMPARMWTRHQRIHQYLGGVIRTWGHVTLNVDLDKLDLRLPSP
jgi:Domain of unknown function (DUF1906)